MTPQVIFVRPQNLIYGAWRSLRHFYENFLTRLRGSCFALIAVQVFISPTSSLSEREKKKKCIKTKFVTEDPFLFFRQQKTLTGNFLLHTQVPKGFFASCIKIELMIIFDNKRLVRDERLCLVKRSYFLLYISHCSPKT